MNYYSRTIDNDMSLRISPLTNVQARTAGPEFEETGGYFLYQARNSDPHNVEVLAHVCSDEAAFRLSRLLGLE